MDDFNPDEIEVYESPRSLKNENFLKLLKISGNKYELEKSAAELLNSTDNELIIVSFLSKVDNEKNYIFNLLCEEKEEFEPRKVDPNDLKIWKDMKYKDKSSSKIVFFELNNLNDPKLFTLLFLVSSVLIYQADKEINDDNINDLNVLKQIQNNITSNSKFDKDAFISETSPKLLYLIKNHSTAFNGFKEEVSSNEYLDQILRKKNQEESNTIKDAILRYFTDRDSFRLTTPNKEESNGLFDNHFTLKDLNPEFKTEFQNLKNKIYNEINPKKLKGKKLNGYSLCNFIEEFVFAINNNKIPNFNTICDSLISKDIEKYYQLALSNFKANIDNYNQLQEEEVLIRSLFEFKMEALSIFNKIINLNQDALGNSQYLAMFNESKRKLETDFSNLESKVLDKNLNESAINCEQILKKEYEVIQQKINKNSYNSKNCDDYLKDHESFLNNYIKLAKGPEKVKKMLEFLSESTPEFIKKFVAILDKENSTKIEEMSEALNEAEKRKVEANSKNKILNENAQNNNDKIAELNSNLEKRKRDITDMDEKIRLLEVEISKIRDEMHSGITGTFMNKGS